MSEEKRNVICDLTVVTYDIGPSLSPFVAEVIGFIREDRKVRHQLTPMGSILEGNWEDVLALVDRLFRHFSARYERIGLTFKVDFRRSKGNRMEGKIAAVEEKLRNL